MNNAELATKWGMALREGDWKAYDALTSDDFQLIGPAPEPLSKAEFLVWSQNILAANPDYHNNFEIAGHSDDSVNAWVRIQGTHTNDWDLIFMDLGIIPATDKSFKNPKEDIVLTCRDGQVTKCEVAVPEDGGIPGIFAQLGIEV